MSNIYSDLDRLILERWSDVSGLAEAQRSVQDRIEEVIEVAAERVGRWLREQSYESECSPRDAEFYAWRSSWADRRKGPMLQIAVGGFCPEGFRKTEESSPYLWVYSLLEDFKVKEPGRAAFAADLRKELGANVGEWDDHDVDDDAPLGRRLSELGVQDQCRLISSPETLAAFAIEHFPKLFALSTVIDTCLSRVQK